MVRCSVEIYAEAINTLNMLRWKQPVIFINGFIKGLSEIEE